MQDIAENAFEETDSVTIESQEDLEPDEESSDITLSTEENDDELVDEESTSTIDLIEKKRTKIPILKEFRANSEIIIDNNDLIEDVTVPQEIKKASRRVEHPSEKEVSKKEEENLERFYNPVTKDDYEKIILAKPNSSYIWIKYIAYALKEEGIESARTIGNRALKRIKHEETLERYNVMASMLALEYQNLMQMPKNGKAKDALLNIVSEGVRMMNDKKINMHYWKILTESEIETDDQKKVSNELIIEQRKKLLKKYKDADVWISAWIKTMEMGDFEKGNSIYENAKNELKKEYITFVQKIALEGYRITGKAEMSRTMFEKLLSEYPKRLDTWILYIQGEIKYNAKKKKDKDNIRRLFERCISGKYSTKGMKTVFKMYLKYEEENGTIETQEKVKETTRKYIEKKMGIDSKQ